MLAIDNLTIISVGSFLRSIFAAVVFLIAGLFMQHLTIMLIFMIVLQCISFFGCGRELRNISHNLVF